MAKGTKRKIPIAKIQKKEFLRTTFTKRRDGLFSKAAEFSRLSGSQIAILVKSSSSSRSNAPLYSFGHSSVDNVVSAFLAGTKPVIPVPDLGLDYWWNDERVYESNNLEELMAARDSISNLLSNLKQNQSENGVNLKKKNQIGTETLNLPLTKPDDIDGDLATDLSKITEEEDQIVALCENFCNAENNNNNSITNLLTNHSEAVPNQFSESKAVENDDDMFENGDLGIQNEEDEVRFYEIFNELETIIEL